MPENLFERFPGEPRYDTFTHVHPASILIFLTTPITLLLGWSLTYFVGSRSLVPASHLLKALDFPLLLLFLL